MKTKFFSILITVSLITGCSVIPGMHMSPFSDQSSTEMPFTENEQTVLKKLNIQSIDAQLIINLEKDFNKRSQSSDSLINQYFDYRVGTKTIKGVPPKEPYSQYRVGPRDVLSITVWEHPELTIPAGEGLSAEEAGSVVGEDGNFYYPYVGIIKAAGKTVEEIRSEMAQKLSQYIEQVQLNVRVATYRSQRVYVVGEVVNPGIQPVKDIPLTILEAINNAGGVKPEADQSNVRLTRDGKTYSINLLSLYEGRDFSQNVLLKAGDTLNVPDRTFNKVFVLGDTSGAGRSIFLNKGRMTLTEAIGEVGGVDQEKSDPARIFVFRGNTGKPEIFHLNA
ncbi:MAG: polysaccharide biosynthesis/export family protein, partial [Bacteroidia bacterium]